jgi:hypothetical protein
VREGDERSDQRKCRGDGVQRGGGVSGSGHRASGSSHHSRDDRSTDLSGRSRSDLHGTDLRSRHKVVAGRGSHNIGRDYSLRTDDNDENCHGDCDPCIPPAYVREAYP